jgi:hypothetical protein
MPPENDIASNRPRRKSSQITRTAQKCALALGDYRTMPPTMMVRTGPPLRANIIPLDADPVGWETADWEWDDFSIRVFFDTEGHVTLYFLDGELEPPSFFERARWFLGL